MWQARFPPLMVVARGARRLAPWCLLVVTVFLASSSPIKGDAILLGGAGQFAVLHLGCGDGRIPVTASKKYEVRSWGFDINPVRVKESLENVEKNNVKHLCTIKLQDIFELDLSKADVITLYLLPQLNVKLIPQLDKLTGQTLGGFNTIGSV